VQELSPREVSALFPLARTEDILAGFYVKEDGRVDPVDVTMALAKGARLQGATIVEGVAATQVLTRGGAVVGVATTAGAIECEYVVNCAGIWARQLGAACGVTVPLQAAEHYYLLTEPIAGVHRDLPVIEDPASHAYIREEGGRAADRALRADLRAVEGGGDPGEFLVRRDRAGLGADGAVPRAGDGAGASVAGGGH
jgi:glycine/D-amino acid oxidase-like deaminating enzyme